MTKAVLDRNSVKEKSGSSICNFLLSGLISIALLSIFSGCENDQQKRIRADNERLKISYQQKKTKNQDLKTKQKNLECIIDSLNNVLYQDSVSTSNINDAIIIAYATEEEAKTTYTRLVAKYNEEKRKRNTLKNHQ